MSSRSLSCGFCAFLDMADPSVVTVCELLCNPRATQDISAAYVRSIRKTKQHCKIFCRSRRRDVPRRHKVRIACAVRMSRLIRPRQKVNFVGLRTDALILLPRKSP